MTESNNEHLALWGGRFTSGPSAALAKLSKSTQFDWRLADDDIAGSRAHARALGRAGLLTDDELNRMEAALDELSVRLAAAQDYAASLDSEVQALIAQRDAEIAAAAEAARMSSMSIRRWASCSLSCLRYCRGLRPVTVWK